MDPNRVTSPSFTLVNQYGNAPLLYHVDLYRIEGSQALEELGLDELVDSAGVVVVEWGERLEGLLEPPTVRVHFRVVADDVREITCRSAYSSL